MIKSIPICTINNAMQMSAMKLAVCYSYDTSGFNDTAYVTFYGLCKGDREPICSAKLETKSSYIGRTFASCVITNIPLKEYPYIQWELTTANGFRLEANPQIILSVNSSLDFINPDVIQEVE